MNPRPLHLLPLVLFLGAASVAPAQYLEVLNKARQQAEKAAQTASRGFGEANWVEGIQHVVSSGLDSAATELAKPEVLAADPKLKPVLPPTLAKLEPVVKAAGKPAAMDHFTAAVNKAVAALAPKAAALARERIADYGVSDPVTLVQTREADAITQEFRKSSEPRVKQALRQLAKDAAIEAGVQVQFRQLLAAAGPAAAQIDPMNTAPLEEMLTAQTINALYAYLAKYEAGIRAKPEAATDERVREVFAALKQ